MITLEERARMADTVGGAIADAVQAGADVDVALATLGWQEMLDSNPDDAIDIVFSALGTANATATALDDVIASALGVEPCADLAVLLPQFAHWDPPGRIGANEFEAHGLTTGRVGNARELLIVCGSESEPRSLVVPATIAEVRAVHGVDPHAGLCLVHARSGATGATRLDPVAWQTAVARARRALAHQIQGSSRMMLELARTHALERVQFGRPIARFQAVRHRLAEAFVAVEALEAALTAARDEPVPETAALAKALAGRTVRIVTRHCQQILAGIGFTTEHAFHRYLKRSLALEGLFGSADAIVLDVGRRLLAERRVPTLIEL